MSNNQLIGRTTEQTALAHAFGEIALLDGNPAQAVQQFDQALDLLRDVAVPYCQASTQFHAGIACIAANQSDAAATHFTNAYRSVKRHHTA